MNRLNLNPIEHPDRLRSYLARERGTLAVVTIFGLLFNGTMFVGPLLQGRLIDAIVDGLSLRRVLVLGGTYVGVILLIQLARYYKRYFVRLFANRTSALMRRMLYHNLLSRDTAEQSGERTGDLMNRAVGDVDICVEGMRKVTTEIFDTGVLLASYYIAMLLMDWRLTLLSCAFVPVAMWMAERLKKRIVRYARDARTQSSLVADLTYENAKNALLLRVNGLDGLGGAAYDAELAELERRSVRSGVLETSMQPIYSAAAILGVGFLFCFGGENVITGLWTVGTFTAYLVIFLNVTTKAGKAAKLFNSYQKAKVSWQRIRPYLGEYRTPEKHGPMPGKTCSLTVRALRFSYPGSGESALDRISFSARQGELIGVTGPVACGKSTLGTALQGLYSYDGSILLDGAELRDYAPDERARLVAWQGHRPELLSDTIYRNITLGDEGDVTQVLRDVCFDEDLKSMPDGVETVVGSGGVRLSGGQQARIALARALYRKSSLVILDDPFSAVDMKTEAAILQNLRTRYADRIILLISHRLAAFPQTNQILVMHADGAVEQGTHEALLASSALYRSIYELQTGGAALEA